MKIIITGSGGQLGLCIRDQFNNTNYDVIYCCKKDLDISNFKKTEMFINNAKPDVIINCAAYTEVDEAEQNQDKVNLINNLAVKNLSEISFFRNIKLIHISTDYVFDGNNKNPYTEEDICNPINLYGMSKLSGEKNIIKSGCQYVIIRTSWVFSEYRKNFVKTMLNIGQQKKQLKIINDQYGRPTYAGDLAILIKKIVDNDGIDNTILNYSGHKTCSWFDFAEKIFEKARFKSLKVPEKILSARTEELTYKARRPKFSVLSSEKVFKKYGIAPSNWELMLSRVIDIYMEENDINTKNF